MNSQFYRSIFKRKSFHLFRNLGDEKIGLNQLKQIESAFDSFEKLIPDIKTAIRIVPSAEIHFMRGTEYCILIYSEKKDNYLMNAGYIGEQLDLYLVNQNIATLWFGIGKPDEPTYMGLDYVIMIAIRKITDEMLFRKDMFKSKRKELAEIWSGESLPFSDVVRFAPSACNTQPWFVKNENDTLYVYRYKKPGKRGIMPAAAVAYYNRIDMGIFLCFMEICMAEHKMAYSRELFIDNKEEEYVPVAEYRKV